MVSLPAPPTTLTLLRKRGTKADAVVAGCSAEFATTDFSNATEGKSVVACSTVDRRGEDVLGCWRWYHLQGHKGR